MSPSLGPLLHLLRLIAADPDVPLADQARTAWMQFAPSEADIEDDFDVAPPSNVDRCEVRLRQGGVEFAPARIPVKRKPGGLTCGASQVVRYAKGPGGIRWKGRPPVSCPVALALARFETVVQEEAEHLLGTRVVRIDHMGTYNCREMAAYPGWVSEHSYANAIDVRSFVLADGREVSVLDHYGDPGTEASDPASAFLRAVARRTYDEDVFSVVLTPAFDRAHRNHFHLDMARYRVAGL